jgi:hypothetical protein
MTKKLLVYLDEDRHEDLKDLAHRHRTTMADLVRYALEKVFEDQLDAMRGQRLLEEHLRDPSGAISLDDYLKEAGIVLPERNRKRRRARPAEVAR